MEAQLNIFNKGLNSDIIPGFHENGMWTFPTINARIYNNGRGFAITNMYGNTKSEEYYTELLPPEYDPSEIPSLNDERRYQDKIYRYINTGIVLHVPPPPDVSYWLYVKEYYPELYFESSRGAEIVLKDRYSLIGAYSIMGIVFLCSVNMDSDLIEIGCFPSPKEGGGFERVYKPLKNIIDTVELCNFKNSITFNWNTSNLLRIEGKVEYDNTVNLYICSGNDLLRVVNNAFDINTGIYLDHRKYKRNAFEEATRNVKTQSLTLTKHIIENEDIVINSTGGTLKYGQYIFYFRFRNLTYDTTKWIFETIPISIGLNIEDDADGYTQGKLSSSTTLSTQSITIPIPVTDAYTDIEVGYIYKGSDNNFDDIVEKGILTETFKIIEGQSTVKVNIQTISSSSVSEWDNEENKKTVELIPGDILAVDNILYQANLSNEIMDVNIIREFFKRVKLKCKVKHGDIPMPTDDVIRNFDINAEIVSRLLGGSFVVGSTTIKYHGDDYIQENPVGDTIGQLTIVLTDKSLNGDYYYNSKTLDSTKYTGGYLYTMDTITHSELLGYSIYTDADALNFTIIEGENEYIFESTNVYNERYDPTDGNLENNTSLDASDYITIVDDNTVYIKISNLSIDGLYCYINNTNPTNKWNAHFGIYDTSGVFQNATITLNYNEIKLHIKSGDNYVDLFIGENEQDEIQNDAYYSVKEHIIEDIGYFGGEIYAFSLLGIDKYGNRYGPFPCTGIDHYYANNLADLEYDAYEDDGTEHYSKLKADENSSYTISGDRKFTKNQQGIYRFPCRANYIKSLDTDNKLIKEEGLSDDIEDYNNDIFNLTQRIKVGDSYSSVINIFKIAFDFTEAYNWLSQADPANSDKETDISLLQQFRNNIVKIVVLRAKRNGDADNLIAQGIIQKPNTIVPYPKFYEFENLDSQRVGILNHNSFEKLVSYNFDMIYNNCCKKGTKWSSNPNLSRFNLHGQLGNSAIKIKEDSNCIGDVIYPDGLRNLDGIEHQRAFIYSGRFCFHDMDMKWDGWYNQVIKYAQGTNIATAPALGAVSFGSNVSNNEEKQHKHNQIDLIWGEMGSQLRDAWTGAYGEYNMFPQQNIFVDNIKGTDRKKWYTYTDDSISIITFNHYKAQYAPLVQYPLAITGAGMKIPFFKGYMPCIHRAGRRNNNGAGLYAYSRMYTTRCMYHPYDLTRAFISPDITFGKYTIDTSTIKYIKPLRKTIYSGLDGLDGNNNVHTTDNIYELHFKADCWKTFFAAPGTMAYARIPWAKNYYGGVHLDTERTYNIWYLMYVETFDSIALSRYGLSKFFSHRTISDSGLRMHQNPLSLMHAIKKYFKIESQRECMPIGDVSLINGVGPKNINIPVSGTERVSLDGNRSVVDYYLNYAYDFTLNYSNTDALTMGTMTSKRYCNSTSTTFFDTYSDLLGNVPQNVLWTSFDSGNGMGVAEGTFIASNRTFKIIPYLALELDANSYEPTKEYPSLSYGVSDYRRMYDYTNNFYDRYVRLSQFTTEKNGKIKTQAGIEGQTIDSLNDRLGNPAQFSKKDIYIDYNYEDLTLVNLYKVNPENITDITDFYTYYTEQYYEIGELLTVTAIGKSNANDTGREFVFGRGDCFLDRVYIKHTTWIPTNVSMGSESYSSGGWDTRRVYGNWEMTGAVKNYNNYMSFFTTGTTSYAHGTTISVITENRYNIALRGEIDATTMNAYPMSENMPTEISSVGFNSRAKRKNIFMVYPEIKTTNDFVYHESLSYNKGYHETLGEIFYAIENDRITYLRNNYPNRIRWSYYANEGSYADGWRQFDIANYYDYDSKYGEIKRIIDINGILISIMPDAMLQHEYDGTDVQVSEEQLLSVGGSKVLSRKATKISDLGISHKHALVKTEKGVYGVDTNKDTLWRIEYGSNYGKAMFNVYSLNKSMGINEWLKEYLVDIRISEGFPQDVTDVTTIIDDDIYDGIGVSAAYDKDYNEVLFTFINDYKSYTMCYSEILEKYTSLYTFDPYLYFNINKDMYSVRHAQKDGYEAKRIYRHNNEYSYRQDFYNNFYDNDFMISLYVNGFSGDRNLSPLSKQFQALEIESQQEPFSTIKYETKDQLAEYPFIDENKWWSKPEYQSHHWQVPIQIDNTSTSTDADLFYNNSSMLGTWLKITLGYIPSQLNKEIFINNILTTFNISNA